MKTFPSAMRYERVKAILALDPAFVNVLKGSVLKVKRRDNGEVSYPIFVVALTDLLHERGFDCHNLDKNVILSVACELMEDKATLAKYAPVESVEVPKKPTTQRVMSAIKNDSYAETLKNMLVEAEASVALFKDQVAKQREKLVQLEAVLNLAEQNALCARVANAAVQRIGKPSEDEEVPAAPSTVHADSSAAPVPGLPAPVLAKVKAATASVAATPGRAAERPGRSLAPDPELLPASKPSLRDLFPDRIGSLVVAKWADRYQSYIEKTALNGQPLADEEGRQALGSEPERDRQRLLFIRKLLERLPKDAPFLGDQEQGPISGPEIKALAWLIALLTPMGLDRLSIDKVLPAIEEACAAAPNYLPRL